MPRIAATLGVFGLVVLALGLNMAQFPIEYGSTVSMVGSANSEPKPDTTSAHANCESVAPSKPANSALAPGSKQEPTEKTSEQRDQSHPSPSVPYRLPTANLPSDDHTGDCNLAASPDFQSFIAQPDSSKDIQHESETRDDTNRLDRRELAEESRITSESDVTVVPEYAPALHDDTQQPHTTFSPASPVGVYNPLEPRPEVDGELPSATAPAMVETQAGLDSPTEAIPNPAYAADPPLGTPEPNLLPVDTAPTDIRARNGVVRLPPVDGAPPIDSTPAASSALTNNGKPSSNGTWPGEPAPQSLPLKWFPSEGYSKSEGP